jgi:hypothetical protein
VTTHHSHHVRYGAALRRTLLAVAALAACGKPRPATQGASPSPAVAVPDSTLADSTAPRASATDSAAAARAAPTHVPMQSSPAGALVGSWVLRTLESSRRGPRLQLAIDSARGTTFRVRVAFLMQGDVGLDPTRFEATRGEITPDGMVHLTIQLRGRAEPEGELAGTLAGDTIRLGTFQWGNADQAATGVHWLLVRER